MTKVFLYAMALIMLGVTVANVPLTGHIPGVPVWAHWIAAAGLGSGTVSSFRQAVES